MLTVYLAILFGSFYEDREGNLWIVPSKGIDNFRNVRVAGFSTCEGMSITEVDSVLAPNERLATISCWLMLTAPAPSPSYPAFYHHCLSSGGLVSFTLLH